MNKNRIRSTKRATSTDGGIMVEAAIIFPLLIILILGIIDIGLSFYSSYMMHEVTRDAGRQLSVSSLFTPADRIIHENRIRDAIYSFTPLTNVVVTVSSPDQPMVPTVPGQAPFPQLGLKIDVTGIYNYFFLRLVGLQNKTIRRSILTRYERQTLGSSFPP